MSNWIWPVPLYRDNGLERVSDEFGPRVSPVPGASTFHRGIDLGWCAGYLYQAAAGGVVKHVGFNGGEGFSIHLLHDDNTLTKYFHSVADSNRVNVGERIVQGTYLAAVGDTGVSGGPHLHWEVHVNGSPVNPRDFMAANTTASSNIQPLEDFLSALTDDEQRALYRAIMGDNSTQYTNIDVIKENVTQTRNALIEPSEFSKPYRPIDVIVTHAKAILDKLSIVPGQK